MAKPTLLPQLAISVSEITHYLRQLLESDEVLQDIWVTGEISNLSRPVSGHIYFSMKDESAALRCVIWKSNALRLGVALQNGIAVEAHGFISLYERDGQYQLYIDTLRPAGEGYLYQEFLRLKARLEAEGLFAAERKRPIPLRPRRIGIVTSATGAALQDMLNTIGQRYPLVEVILAPAAVQGTEAPPELAAAIRALNKLGGVDVILIGRGGGSLEDLWAFNDERVVRAVAGSSAPVIAGIGHETDFTLTDFAADLRAPTPTGAAVQATPDIADLKQELLAAESHLAAALQEILIYGRSALENLDHGLQRVSPLLRIQNDSQRLDELGLRLERGLGHEIRLRRAQLAGNEDRLRSLNPLAVLKRGFSLVRRQDGAIVTSIGQVQIGQDLSIHVSDGEIETKVIRI
ncbi:MAG TPA: exodeoxyribonuclease VII large subunit [Anaerolineaceae bacterium]